MNRENLYRIPEKPKQSTGKYYEEKEKCLCGKRKSYLAYH